MISSVSPFCSSPLSPFKEVEKHPHETTLKILAIATAILGGILSGAFFPLPLAALSISILSLSAGALYLTAHKIARFFYPPNVHEPQKKERVVTSDKKTDPIQEEIEEFHLVELSSPLPIEKPKKLHNLPLYGSGIVALKELKENNDHRKNIAYFLNPLEIELINPFVDFLSHYLFEPVLEKAAISISEKDPISTKTFAKWNDKVRSLARLIGLRTPTKLPVLSYFDTCSIVAARHLYVYSNDLQTVLQLPSNLHGITTMVKDFTQGYLSPKAAPLVEENLSVDLSLVGKARQLATSALFSGQFLINSALKKGASLAVDLIHGNITEYLLEREKEIRKVLIRKTVEFVGKSTFPPIARWGLRSGICYIVSGVATQSFQAASPYLFEPKTLDMMQTTSHIAARVLPFLGILLWAHCLTPTMNRLYESYEPEFDPEATTLRELTYIGQKKLNAMKELASGAFGTLGQMSARAGQIMEKVKKFNPIPQFSSSTPFSTQKKHHPEGVASFRG